MKVVLKQYRDKTDYEVELPMKLSDFFMHVCTGYGSDWVASLFSGLKVVRPDLWDSIPSDKPYSFDELVQYLIDNKVVYL